MRALSIQPGQRFGQLTIIRETKKIGVRRAFMARCDCGKKCTVKLIQISTGKTQSCGCLKWSGDANRSHGYSGTPTYIVWTSMLQRCDNPKGRGYVNYGGRGIKVCKRWHKFENFLADMGERPSAEHEISRPDNDGDYKPGNAQWSDDSFAQTRNRRKRKNTSSRFRGVDWWKDIGWRARISVDGTVIYLGLFKKEKEAAHAYDAVARQHPGYLLNFKRRPDHDRDTSPDH
jgi:hypothetical protein